jgi:hypothetical protein
MTASPFYDAPEIETLARAYLDSLRKSCGQAPTAAERDEFHRLKVEKMTGQISPVGRRLRELVISVEFTLLEIRRLAEEIERGGARLQEPN